MKLLCRLKTSPSLHPTNLLPDRNLNPAANRRAAEQRCLSLLRSCSAARCLSQLHAYILKHGLLTNPLVLTKFTSTASDLNAVDYASAIVFSPEADTSLYDTFLFNTIIRAYALNKDVKAVGLFNSMLRFGALPNQFTYPFVLKACAAIGDLKLGRAVHGSAVKFGLNENSHVRNTLVHVYGSCVGGIECARKLFDEIPSQDSVSWSAMIGGYVRAGQSADAVALFRKMQVSGVKPDEITMVLVLSACADLGALECGRWVESFIVRERVERSVELCNALIGMFAKCGDLKNALRVFRDMDDKTIVSWTSVIGGMAMHGYGSESVALFEEMINARVVPDDVAFIGLLSACSHSGLVQEGRKYFNLMKEKFGIEPKIEHYGCLVDLLCRGGLIKEAVEFVDRMPIEPNPIIWRTLTSMCRAQGELELGERISKKLIEEEPMRESNYVLLSNIYAKTSRWEKKTKIREAMDTRGMRKVPGSTLIELDNEIYEFVAGDKSHDQYEKIYEMVDEMGKEMRRAGYLPSTSEVLLDIDEEDKEDALNRHSEKLAIAFALLKTPPAEEL
ncbi:pentatricopeptide repeat-containing protein At4g21065-like isoform X2 [Punica granatum]|uniref:Pentatricopeptide repeat-containing protein At4g21065-like isoform X2 n=1 Tax=Punica granatum TaxID=22663 RepID=A0A6P8BPQ1_PUNGR|nr:pentatricopeptide repeat-containing protein At4g21065-like isoform X2 [Punica granatum]